MMKKRLFPLILALALLCGCAPEAPPAESAPTAAQTQQTTLPAGLYAPDSAVEAATGGAVRCYPLGGTGASQLLILNGAPMVVSGSETGTTFTLLCGDSLYPAAVLELDSISAEGALALQPCDGGFSFYDEGVRETVVLDVSLREIRRIAAPEGLQGHPLLSADRSTLYYFTSDALRALDLESGISRVLKEMSYDMQVLDGLCLNDTVLECSIADGETWGTLFLSTQTGQTLGSSQNLLCFRSAGDRYYASYFDGSAILHLFGASDGDAKVLTPLGNAGDCTFLPENHAAVTIRQPEDGSIILDYYDLNTGRRTASVALAMECYPWGFASLGDGRVCFLSYDETYGCDILCLWDTAASPTGDDTCRTGPHYTRDNPDYDGLAVCTLYAQDLSSRYGVEVRIYKDAVAFQPWDYDLEPEYLVSVLQTELEQLDARLANYPEGFLRTLAECFGGIRICIVRSITGSPESGSLEAANGLQFWDDAYVAYLALAAGMDTEHALYHELCHLIDTKVFNECSAYDSWNSLNPKDFAYDYDYTANLDRDGSKYLEEKRYFIDTYSMSFPNEDRARIMEYAMTEGNGAYFQSTPMQAKLLTICQGIREAFGLEKSPETFLWEQYLNVSLAYRE